ncbi:hypothetical protein SDC9_206793 [bioreactor metagenome]|uniref:Uncharacterized protein n=1 Tax=bioreactor metagenome TaxID=1076179 RepID=A0A645J5S6_9ZZZZ
MPTIAMTLAGMLRIGTIEQKVILPRMNEFELVSFRSDTSRFSVMTSSSVSQFISAADTSFTRRSTAFLKAESSTYESLSDAKKESIIL